MLGGGGSDVDLDLIEALAVEEYAIKYLCKLRTSELDSIIKSLLSTKFEIEDNHIQSGDPKPLGIKI